MSRNRKRQWPGSIRIRITTVATVVVAAALLLGALLLVNNQRRSLTSDVRASASQRADDLARLLETGALPEELKVPNDDASFVQVVDLGTGAIVASSSNTSGEAQISQLAPRAGSPQTATANDLPVGDSAFIIAAQRVDARRHRYIVYAGSSLLRVNTATASLARSLLLGLPGLVLFVAAITWFAVDRSLRPVEAIRKEVAAMTEHQRRRRVPEPSRDDEIGRLARTMNSMLSRIDDAHDRQRKFVADASHELRSPLTALRSQIEVDIAHPSAALWRTTERHVLQETIRMQALIDDLLALARADEQVLVEKLEAVDVDDIVLGEARRLREQSNVAVDTRGVSSGQVVGDADALRRLVRNLCDNAQRHALSKVTFGVRESGDTVVVSVADDGAGIAEADRERVFERFARVDNHRNRAAGGTGLGLAIAREIVEAHDGTIQIVDRQPGAQFVITLPKSGGTL